MLMTQIEGSDQVLLSYSLHSRPSPLHVSGSETVTAKLSVLITYVPPPQSKDAEVRCSEIALSFTIGAEAGNLAATAGGIKVSQIENWTVHGQLSGSTYSVLLEPTKGDERSIDAKTVLLLEIHGLEMNKQVGTAPVKVTEVSRLSKDSLKNRQATLLVSKFPHAFTFGGFLSESPVVPHGGSTTLAWEGSPSGDYTFRVDDGPVRPLTAQEKNDRRIHTGALSRPTLYTLQVEAGSGNDRVKAIQRTLVLVHHPDLFTSRLTVGKTNSEIRWAQPPIDFLLSLSPGYTYGEEFGSDGAYLRICSGNTGSGFLWGHGHAEYDKDRYFYDSLNESFNYYHCKRKNDTSGDRIPNPDYGTTLIRHSGLGKIEFRTAGIGQGAPVKRMVIDENGKVSTTGILEVQGRNLLEVIEEQQRRIQEQQEQMESLESRLQEFLATASLRQEK